MENKLRRSGGVILGLCSRNLGRPSRDFNCSGDSIGQLWNVIRTPLHQANISSNRLIRPPSHNPDYLSLRNMKTQMKIGAKNSAAEMVEKMRITGMALARDGGGLCQYRMYHA